MVVFIELFTIRYSPGRLEFTMKLYPGIILLITGILLSGCGANPYADTVHQTDYTVLDFNVADIVDHGEFSRYMEILWPYELEDNCFYYIESPKYLDSLFQSIEYTYPPGGPRLEDFFPEDGMLLLYFDTVWSSTAYINHKISFSADTVSIDVSLTENPSMKNDGKCIYYLIIPIGIIPE